MNEATHNGESEYSLRQNYGWISNWCPFVNGICRPGPGPILPFLVRHELVGVIRKVNFFLAPIFQILQHGLYLFYKRYAIAIQHL